MPSQGPCFVGVAVAVVVVVFLFPFTAIKAAQKPLNLFHIPLLTPSPFSPPLSRIPASFFLAPFFVFTARSAQEGADRSMMRVPGMLETLRKGAQHK